jgi:hypothetical protein
LRRGASEVRALLLIGRIFAEARILYAIIGGVSLQMHWARTPTPLDTELAVAMGILP